ncbi:unnamed protein product [Amoebophrya sp. A25]|nr:unnamed protein product [Amoebophrya sp. A25]|eukprot:GSA25T00006150001.1
MDHEASTRRKNLSQRRGRGDDAPAPKHAIDEGAVLQKRLAPLQAVFYELQSAAQPIRRDMRGVTRGLHRAVHDCWIALVEASKEQEVAPSSSTSTDPAAGGGLHTGDSLGDVDQDEVHRAHPAPCGNHEGQEHMIVCTTDRTKPVELHGEVRSKAEVSFAQRMEEVGWGLAPLCGRCLVGTMKASTLADLVGELMPNAKTSTNNMLTTREQNLSTSLRCDSCETHQADSTSWSMKIKRPCSAEGTRTGLAFPPACSGLAGSNCQGRLWWCPQCWMEAKVPVSRCAQCALSTMSHWVPTEQDHLGSSSPLFLLPSANPSTRSTNHKLTTSSTPSISSSRRSRSTSEGARGRMNRALRNRSCRLSSSPRTDKVLDTAYQHPRSKYRERLIDDLDEIKTPSKNAMAAKKYRVERILAEVQKNRSGSSVDGRCSSRVGVSTSSVCRVKMKDENTSTRNVTSSRLTPRKNLEDSDEKVHKNKIFNFQVKPAPTAFVGYNSSSTVAEHQHQVGVRYNNNMKMKQKNDSESDCMPRGTACSPGLTSPSPAAIEVGIALSARERMTQARSTLLLEETPERMARRAHNSAAARNRFGRGTRPDSKTQFEWDCFRPCSPPSHEGEESLKKASRLVVMQEKEFGGEEKQMMGAVDDGDPHGQTKPNSQYTTTLLGTGAGKERSQRCDRDADRRTTWEQDRRSAIGSDLSLAVDRSLAAMKNVAQKVQPSSSRFKAPASGEKNSMWQHSAAMRTAWLV